MRTHATDSTTVARTGSRKVLNLRFGTFGPDHGTYTSISEEVLGSLGLTQGLQDEQCLHCPQSPTVRMILIEHDGKPRVYMLSFFTFLPCILPQSKVVTSKIIMYIYKDPGIFLGPLLKHNPHSLQSLGSHGSKNKHKKRLQSSAITGEQRPTRDHLRTGLPNLASLRKWRVGGWVDRARWGGVWLPSYHPTPTNMTPNPTESNGATRWQKNKNKWQDKK